MRLGLVFAIACLAAAGCSRSDSRRPELRQPPPAAVEASAWPEADALFHRDPHFLGGDAAVSVALDHERILWLFGDSFIARGPGVTRAEAAFVRNSVAVQSGTDPCGAELRLYTGVGPSGEPQAFFAAEGASWLWPGHGVWLDGALTLFFMRVGADAAPGGLGFRVQGSRALRVPNPEAEPSAWRFEPLPLPEGDELGVVGAALVAERAYVYAYAVREPGDHGVTLLRWTRDDFARGELRHPEAFGGAGRGFASVPAATVLTSGATEFSVSPWKHGYLAVQAHGFGAVPLAVRFAPALSGPWSEPLDVYRPPEAARAGTLIYAARAHPELSGADVVLTYASNSLDPASVVRERDLYWPRFVRVWLR